ncbi:hypothetical protein SO802_023166 [Lithocarpus litseifolius]|uniref:Reverse transcriptase domain-containing protein n=1 Tax=Lithocarpus litseifolius TaxID=425828 RepID=A0AAW2C6Z6_9ROSI
MGFFIDAYDLSCISLCTNLLGLIYYRVDGAAKPAGSLPPNVSAVANGVALCGTMAEQHFFMDGLVTSWAERESMKEECLSTVKCMVTDDMRDFLSTDFTAEEVKVALFQMGPTKAPRPDGMNALFYQKFWHVVGDSVVLVVLEFLNNDNMLPDINHTNIVLIPKVKNPERMSQFRPISLCNVIYKIISKVLANRLKQVLPQIISPTQSAFVLGRLITDNVLVAYETLHTMHSRKKGKKGYMALKLDISKAYDRVEWHFLHRIMEKLGFPAIWIDRATRAEGETIAEILQTYERASGQRINLEKSSAYFSSNISDRQKGQILDVLGVNEVDRFETYLGLPTLIGRAKYHIFSFLKDRIWKKLQGWKGMLLSKAGKEILIKAVAQSKPTNSMSVFQIPKKLCDELDALCAKFWWGQQGWRMVKGNDSLLYQCFKARYFPRSNFLEAKESPNYSYVWRSLMAAMPILQSGHCWRVGNGASIHVLKDKWIPYFPTNKVLVPIHGNLGELMVCDLINPELNIWRYEDIRSIFHKDKADAICQIPLSRRNVADSIFWQYNPRGVFTVKSAYHVARRILTEANRVGPSRGCVAKQKYKHGQADLVQLMEEFLERMNMEEIELFWTQSWLIWSQCNCLLHGGKMKIPTCLNKRAEECIEDFKKAQNQLNIQSRQQPSGEEWRPPPLEAYKLNFDATLFSDLGRTGYGAIVRNEKGEVMAAMTASGPDVHTSDEAELLAYRRAIKFAVDAGFSRLVIKGDNSNAIQAISSSEENTSLYGNVVEDIRHLIRGLLWSDICCIRRGENRVAHALAQHARHALDEDLYWVEDLPPPPPPHQPWMLCIMTVYPFN